MIRELDYSEINEMLKLLKNDVARNYFILLTLLSKIESYDKIYGEWDDEQELIAILLKRKSKTLQFYAKGLFDIDGFVKIIKTLKRCKSMISPRSYCDAFLNKGIFTTYVEASYISKLSHGTVHNFNFHPEVVKLEVEDLGMAVDLYSKVFNSHASRDIMERKILSGRGRGFCIKEGSQIISIAQTDFEGNGSGLIVGVATDPIYQGKGLATKCLETLIRELDRDLYLLYNNEDAGRLYEKLGFKVVDQVRHYKR